MANTNLETRWFRQPNPTYGYYDFEDVYAKIVDDEDAGEAYFLKSPGQQEREVERDSALLDEVIRLGTAVTEAEYEKA